ncbi:MAG: IclR family transcriptional regulator [Pseudomonadota bacterium]
MAETKVKHRQGIQSIEVGSSLLRVLAQDNRPMMLRDLAKNAGMPAAKAHRYLVSFVRTGLVKQDAGTGRYDLGDFALELGLASLSRLDAVRLASPVLEELCEHIGETVALAVWGTHGATCVRWVETGEPVSVILRTGVVLPLTTAATGRAFAAFYRSRYLKELLSKELSLAAAVSKSDIAQVTRDFEAVLAETREHGIARACGSWTPGINGFSAPVFDHTGMMVAAITVLGTTGHFDIGWDSALAQTTKQAALTLSKRLGHASRQMLEHGGSGK